MLKPLSLMFAFVIASMFITAAPVEAAVIKARAETASGQSLKFKAEYREKVKHGVTKSQQLRVRVRHALPLQTLEVSLNGQVIGTITTNVIGRGKLVLKTPQNVLPFIHSGDVLVVGPATAMFFTKADRYKVHGHISADGSTVSGIVKYHQKPHQGILDQRFMVNIQGALAGEVFDVAVNDVLVGSVTADDLGEGQLKLRTAAFANGSWQPLPADFPSLHAGDTVTVGGIIVPLH